MLAWAVPVLLIALAGLLWATAAFAGSAGRLRAPLVIAAGFVPALLILSQLLSAQSEGRFGDLRLSVMSVKLSSDAIEGATIGGDRAHDFLLVGDLPASLITLHRVSDREVALQVARPLRGEVAGAVAFEDAEPDLMARSFGARPHFVGERPVREGEVYCPRGCDSPCRIRLPVDGDRLSIEDDPSAPLPRMETRGLGVSWSPEQRIYPLRSFASPVSGSCTDALAGDIGKGLPVTAILFRHGGFDSRLYGLYLDSGSEPDAVLERGGKALRIHLYRVDYTESVEEEHDRPSRIVERRSVTAQLQQNGDLTITFDTPEDIQLPAKAIAKVMSSKPGEDIVLPIDNDRGAGRAFVGDSTLQFRSLGGQLAETALGRILLHPDRETKSLAPYFTVVGSGQTRNVSFGDRFTLGSSYSAEFALERLARDSGVLAFLTWPFLLLAAAAAIAGSWEARRTSLPALLLLTLTETLLAFRLLIAISGAYVDASAARAEIVPSALFAYLAIPYLVAHLAGGKRTLLGSLAQILIIGVVGVAAERVAGLDKVSLVIAVFAGLALIADILSLPTLPKEVREALSKLWSRIGAGLSWPLQQLQAQLWYPQGPYRPLVGLIVLIVVRLALLLAGIKEGIPVFGFRIALSTLYLPFALILLARLLFDLRKGEDRTLWKPLLWSFAVALAFATPIAARDTGFIIFALGTAVLGVIAMMSTDEAQSDPWFWPAAMLVLPFGFLAICYVLLHSFIAAGAIDFAIAGAAVLIAIAIGVTAMHQSSRLAQIAQPLPLALLAVAAALLAIPFIALSDLADAAYMDFGAVLVFAVLWKRPVACWGLSAAFALALALSFQLPVLPSAPIADGASAHDRTAERELEDQMQKTQNILRIWYSVRPGDVGDFATSSAQNLGAAMAHLHDYGACPDSQWPACLKGHGYLAIPRPTVLAPYHLNDNVTAIHLIAPFGRLGAAAFLLLLAAGALLYTQAAIRQDGRVMLPSTLRLAGIAALWTIFGAALYMILANLEVLPFTGKNVYFLAASSGSDLLEGTVLIALAMAAAARGRA